MWHGNKTHCHGCSWCWRISEFRSAHQKANSILNAILSDMINEDGYNIHIEYRYLDFKIMVKTFRYIICFSSLLHSSQDFFFAQDKDIQTSMLYLHRILSVKNKISTKCNKIIWESAFRFFEISRCAPTGRKNANILLWRGGPKKMMISLAKTIQMGTIPEAQQWFLEQTSVLPILFIE